MSDFKCFIKSVRSRGGVWAGDDVYFSQHRDGYSAGYKPQYPEASKEDKEIYCPLWKTKKLYER